MNLINDGELITKVDCQVLLVYKLLCATEKEEGCNFSGKTWSRNLNFYLHSRILLLDMGNL